MTDKIDRTYQVLGGPSREELFDALRLIAESRNVQFDYIFKAQPWEKDDPQAQRFDNTRQTTSVNVRSIAAVVQQVSGELLTGKEWVVDGWVTAGYAEADVRIFYNTQLRTGMIIINPEAERTPGEYDGIIGSANPEGQEPPPPEDQGGDGTDGDHPPRA